MSRLIKERRKSSTPSLLVTQQEKNEEMAPLISDTTCNLEIGSSSWEGIYQLFEKEKLQVILDRKYVADDNLFNDSESWTDTTNYFLDRIASRPKMIPYTDLVKWVLENVDIRDRKFVTRSRTIIVHSGRQISRKCINYQNPRRDMTPDSFKISCARTNILRL